ncbi:MAG: hypothetical protein JRC86_03045 [Deltaproteobacteria bacterium]|nr:hypothetical protein [Deltaproteobacteria bacterium]
MGQNYDAHPLEVVTKTLAYEYEEDGDGRIDSRRPDMAIGSYINPNTGEVETLLFMNSKLVNLAGMDGTGVEMLLFRLDSDDESMYGDTSGIKYYDLPHGGHETMGSIKKQSTYIEEADLYMLRVHSDYLYRRSDGRIIQRPDERFLFIARDKKTNEITRVGMHHVGVNGNSSIPIWTNKLDESQE